MNTMKTAMLIAFMTALFMGIGLLLGGRGGMLVALGKPNELKIHVRGALTNGATRAEIQEVLLQSCVYCGVPAAGEGFRMAREVFEEAEFAAAP